MSYYGRGDYYRGDYYRGDPGVFSFIEKGAKALARAVIPGAGLAIDAYRTIRKAVSPGTGGAAMTHAPYPSKVLEAAGGFVGRNLPQLPRALGLTEMPMIAGPNGACPKGFRLNKSSYFLQDGTFIPEGTKCVRFRSMNPLNPRALRKGLRRAEGFERIARRTVNALRSGPRKFKKRTRKS